MSLLAWPLVLGPHTCPWWFGYTVDNPRRRAECRDFADRIRLRETAPGPHLG